MPSFFQPIAPLTPVVRPLETATPWVSTREMQVLGGVADGYSNAEIARRIGIAPDTVKGYVASIRSKLAARNRAHLVAQAIRAGLIA